ncbi:hypothetical protein [Okeania sp. KiyG1]|uniref:hypothetical protein n=1 Tax=Okeania sp. KiyG1 TaxID=2720165 RepID=UPI00192459C6|nr:hypothetical protein [Okeania sp. KiyG1]GGA25038.1 hypothetical protein CYANOKiyG1_40690 [Okeania sp. KiyG1]
MSATSEPEKKLKVVSLQPKVIFTQKSEPERVTESVEEEVILAPFMIDEEQVIEDLSELVDKVYDEFSQACKKRNLTWEAELELGMEFGVKFTAKLKIAPKS